VHLLALGVQLAAPHTLMRAQCFLALDNERYVQLYQPLRKRILQWQRQVRLAQRWRTQTPNLGSCCRRWWEMQKRIGKPLLLFLPESPLSPPPPPPRRRRRNKHASHSPHLLRPPALLL
jgi:hypothetical protein